MACLHQLPEARHGLPTLPCIHRMAYLQQWQTKCCLLEYGFVWVHHGTSTNYFHLFPTSQVAYHNRPSFAPHEVLQIQLRPCTAVALAACSALLLGMTFYGALCQTSKKWVTCLVPNKSFHMLVSTVDNVHTATNCIVLTICFWFYRF